MEKFEEIIKRFPNAMSGRYPVFVSCTDKRRDEKLPFLRLLPKVFQIDGVRRIQSFEKPYCVWEVKYSLVDGSDLPTGPKFDMLIKDLLMLTPLNAHLMGARFELPKIAIVYYGVRCRCHPILFVYPEEAAEANATKIEDEDDDEVEEIEMPNGK